MVQCVAFADWLAVKHAIARVHRNTNGAARGVQEYDGLNGTVYGVRVEGLEYDLIQAFPIRLWVPGGVRRVGREPRIPVTGRDGLVTDKLRLNLTEFVAGEDATLLLEAQGELEGVGDKTEILNTDPAIPWHIELQ